MYAVRRWSVRHARFHESSYALIEGLLVALHPLLKRIGYPRLERLMIAVERPIKGFLFDCQMCGRCVLTSTGMSCPMNCPKQLRNGPCGGVRSNGHCEVKPDMRCVWMDAWEGSRVMRDGQGINNVQVQVEFDQRGKSAWLRAARERVEAQAAAIGSKP